MIAVGSQRAGSAEHSSSAGEPQSLSSNEGAARHRGRVADHVHQRRLPLSLGNPYSPNQWRFAWGKSRAAKLGKPTEERAKSSMRLGFSPGTGNVLRCSVSVVSNSPLKKHPPYPLGLGKGGGKRGTAGKRNGKRNCGVLGARMMSASSRPPYGARSACNLSPHPHTVSGKPHGKKPRAAVRGVASRVKALSEHRGAERGG